MFDTLRAWAARLRRDVLTLWFACRHPATPWLTRGLCALIVAYAFSPIDLIPDFVPVLGYLDEIVLLPALIWCALRTLPAPLADSCRAQAQCWLDERRGKPRSYWGAAIVVALWLAAALLAWRWWRG
ncbi:DUF1232 domain-containing protein [Cupriavidus gilardii]|uniref:YkvA family protein n=1 Tax=Cupriavidus gilardii TaxID=82541 RepID=UPI001ABE390E|nr:YkvA family protein [Cupriavidus gilardii]MBO4120235.1 DUF1232 domain-containing protein [Cupriavidus gilardii]